MVALITGASRGLGRELAHRLSNNGYRVIVNYVRPRLSSEAISTFKFQNSITVRADVGDAGEVEALKDIITDKFGRLDVIINNAAITEDGILINYNEKNWDEVIKVNLKGCFNIVRYLAPLMIKSGGGHIINVASRSGLRGKAGQSAYSASKSALLGMTYSLAKELADFNIRVNCIIPGYMLTDMGRKSARAMEMAKRESLLDTLTDIDDVVLFVEAILRTKTVTGQIFSIDSRL